MRVLNYELPFSLGLQGKFLTNIGSAPQIRNRNRPDVLNIPKPVGTLWKEDPEKSLQTHIDYVRGIFSTIRNLARQDLFDVIFLTIRSIDSWGHFLHPEQRQRLINYIDLEMEEIEKSGSSPIFSFSDHGITEKQDSFYINKFLQSEGWLDIDFWEKGWEKNSDDDLVQVGIHSPLVQIKEGSYFVSPDAYDSGIKVLRDDAPVDELVSALMDTGMYRGIYRPKELYGDGPYLGDLGVDLVCDRADGVLVTGNVHPGLEAWKNVGKKCQGEIRTGVHNRYGFWGTNREGKEDDFSPDEFYSVLRAFIEENSEKPDNEKLYGFTTSREDTSKLEDLGYL